MTYYYDTNDGLLKVVEDAQEIEDGGGYKIDVPALSKAKNEIDREVDAFKSAEKKIRMDRNPAITEEIKEYELKRLESEFTAKIRQIESEYHDARNQVIEQAYQQAARAVESIDDKAKDYASQKFSMAAVAIKSTASADGQRRALRELAETIKQMTDAEKLALQPMLLELNVNEAVADEFRKVLREAQRLKRFDYYAPKALEQLPLSPSVKLTTFRAVRSKHRGL